MPLPSHKYSKRPLCGAKCKRTGLPCQNLPVRTSKAGRCRMHGGIIGKRNVLRGADHPQYKNAGQTRQERHARRAKSLMFQRLEEIGWHIGLFAEGSTKTRGRKVGGKLDLNQDDELMIALYETINNAKN
jgi:hypothetical protein